MDFPVFDREGSTTLIEGKRRSGKTFLNALICLPYADVGVKGYSNYFLDSVNNTVISFYQLINLLNGEPFEPYTYVSLQEIYAFGGSSHRAMSDDTEGFDMLNFQSGKLGINLVGDSQLISRADDSLRKLANYRFEAEKDTLNGCFVYHEVDVRFPNDTVYTDDDFSIDFHFASHFWDRYRTRDRTKPVGYDALMASMEKHEPVLMNATIQRQTDLIRKVGGQYGIYSRGDINKIRVENCLLMNGEHIVFSAQVTDRLKWQW